MLLIIRPLGIAVAFALGLSLGFAGPASAHAHLKSAKPAVNGTVATSPKEIDLTFTEGVNLKFTGVTITGPGKAPVKTQDGKFGPGGDTTLIVPVGSALPPGAYTVDWHALAKDGHKTQGTYTFTVKP
ncbi:MAG TPA: copper homeostasis periplasmic binding protein CopC [Xanthobacteraceae bacterium]|jgi:methionine-rich copper-binding protein CopC|nr:copper homeostasis periplasmic binding protein CopC [Xanthobacteraceae bacterium]